MYLAALDLNVALNTREKLVAAILACFTCLVFNLLAWSLWNSTYIFVDGVQYLSTAKNWLDGHGFSTNTLMYTPHFQGVLPAPQTVWPPGYPLLIALTSMVGIPIQTAALLLNLFFLAASALLTLAILLRCKIAFSSAVLFTLLFYCTAIPWVYSIGLLTEPVFGTLILAAIALLPDPEKDRIWQWFACGTALALCVTVRYSGVFFAMGVGAGLFVYLVVVFHKDLKRFATGVSLLTLLISISVTCFLALQYRTYLLTGTIRRETGGMEPDSLVDTILSIIWQIRRLLGFVEAGIQSNITVKVITGLFAIVLIYVLTQSFYTVIRTKNQNENSANRYRRVACFVILAHTAVFIIFFCIVSAEISSVSLNDRYLYQIFPGVFILICLLVSEALTRMQTHYTLGFIKWFQGSLVALAILFLVAQINFITGIKSYSAAGLHAREVLALQVTEKVDLNMMIRSCVVGSENRMSTLWSNDSQLLHLYTTAPTVSTPDVYANIPNVFEVLADQIDTYDIKMFVIVNNLPNITPEYAKLLDDLKHWLMQNGHTKVPMQEHQISDNIYVETYVIDQLCLNSI